MKTPEPLTIERLYELCEYAKAARPGTKVKVDIEEFWALVEMAKERNEVLRDVERYRYFKKCFSSELALVSLARLLGCVPHEFLPSLDQAIDIAITHNGNPRPFGE